MKNFLKNILKSSIKPAKIIKEIKAAPEGGVGNLYRPAIVKMVIKFIFFWGLIAMLIYAISKGIVDKDILKIVLEEII